jgi:pyruvate dehydrogenase E2 component (dihydrolipoamide acetyltransferase)
MPTAVIMPALGLAQETGKVVRWLRREGDTVVRGEPLLEIETDKVTVEIEAPADGRLAGIVAVEGEEVPVGRTIAQVLAGDEAPEAEPTVTARRRLASPKARSIAAALGVDLDAVAGSGPGGAVVAADLDAHRAEVTTASTSSTWSVMAERVTRSWQSVPQFTLRREIDATRLLSWRAAVSDAEASLTDLLVRLAAEALRRHPAVNASWRDGAIVPAAEVNVAVAVATDDGLVVPVIHGADRLDLAGIAARRREVVDAARAGRLRPEDVAGGTFTISNLGMYGVDSFDAIVNAPQAAILAVGRVVERLVPVGGRPVALPMLALGLSFDHRVVDGARGAEFLSTLAGLAEEPAALVR